MLKKISLLRTKQCFKYRLHCVQIVAVLESSSANHSLTRTSTESAKPSSFANNYTLDSSVEIDVGALTDHMLTNGVLSTPIETIG